MLITFFHTPRKRLYGLLLLCISALPAQLAGCQSVSVQTLQISSITADTLNNQFVVVTQSNNWNPPPQYNPFDDPNPLTKGPTQLQYFDKNTQTYQFITDLQYSSVNGIAVDPIHRRVFYTTSRDFDALSVVDLDTGLEKIVTSAIENPGAVVYDEVDGQIFVLGSKYDSTSGSSVNSLIRVNLESTLIQSIFVTDDSLWNLAIDSVGRRLFVSYGDGVMMVDIESGEQAILADVNQSIGIGPLQWIKGIQYDEAQYRLLLLSDNYIYGIDPLTRLGGELFFSSDVMPPWERGDSITLVDDSLIFIHHLDSDDFGDPSYLHHFQLSTKLYSTVENNRMKTELSAIYSAKTYIENLKRRHSIITIFMCIIDRSSCPLPPHGPGHM